MDPKQKQDAPDERATKDPKHEQAPESPEHGSGAHAPGRPKTGEGGGKWSGGGKKGEDE